MISTTKKMMAVGAWCMAGALMMANAHDQLPGGSLSSFDLDEDGAITATEFATGITTQAADLQKKFLAKYDSVPTGQTVGDGNITTAEAVAVFEDNAADWLEHVLETFDTNDDGAISDADSTSGRRRPGRAHLDEYDANDDGVISNAELLAAAKEKVDAQLEKFLARYDSIPTGATVGDGVITAAESLAVHTAAVEERVDAILERLDANNDGALSSDEWGSATGKRPKSKRGFGERVGR